MTEPENYMPATSAHACFMVRHRAASGSRHARHPLRMSRYGECRHRAILHPLHDRHLLKALQESAVPGGRLQSPFSPCKYSVCVWSTFERLCAHSWMQSERDRKPVASG